MPTGAALPDGPDHWKAAPARESQLADRVGQLRIEGLVGCDRYCDPMGRPDISQIRGLAIGRAIAAKLRAEPDLLNIGRTNLRRFRAMDTPGEPWLDEWQARIDAGVESVAEVLEADTEHGHDMRQMAPFAGVLTVRERDAVLRGVYGREAG